ncbi:phenylalanine--tRNA ligase subunit alpha [Longibacter sp.]|jgi:phenylalanyl-tRNA synthetase alpha chain|uniref:phenylalanine--tRNA ligase subunit alpha n=1 Tax=Longibacter sp. TaxID=2045415 RepID=UPI003EBA28AB
MSDDRIDALRDQIESETIESEEEAEAFRIQYLGRKQGAITNLFGQISEIPPEERPAFGKNVNALKAMAEQKLESALQSLQREQQGGAADIDLTLPGRRDFRGTLHPLTQTLNEILRILRRLGFETYEGPEVESDWHNFTALNFPPDHPARDMQDTFFVKDAPDAEDGPAVLRTHTSPAQIRIMQEQDVPLRVAVPGRVYRNEAISYKSFCLFHQVELLYVDEGVSMAALKQTLFALARALFGEDVRLRFRPSYFPFTEPSAEVDVWGEKPDHADGGEWMEILGCGMVHPNVFRSAGVDPERYTGYAVGMGVERMTMLRYGIDDIRTFYENDVRFLDQF